MSTTAITRIRMEVSNAELLGPKCLSPLVQWDTIERVYPWYPTIDDVQLHRDRNCWLDLRPYANTAPYTINETASIQVCMCVFAI